MASENGAKTAGRLFLQFAGPAILAGISAYVGVSVKLARFEERLGAIQSQMELRDSYYRRDIEALWQSNRLLAERIEHLRQK